MKEQQDPPALKIGFVGVGVIGRPMASNLLKAGFPCTIYDLNPDPLRILAEEGAIVANNVVEVARNADRPRRFGHARSTSRSTRTCGCRSLWTGSMTLSPNACMRHLTVTPRFEVSP